MPSTAAATMFRSNAAALAFVNPYAAKLGANTGVGAGVAPTSAPTGGGERAIFGPDDAGPLGLPTPALVAGGVALAAIVGLVVYKVRKKKKR